MKVQRTRFAVRTQEDGLGCVVNSYVGKQSTEGAFVVGLKHWPPSPTAALSFDHPAMQELFAVLGLDDAGCGPAVKEQATNPAAALNLTDADVERIADAVVAKLEGRH